MIAALNIVYGEKGRGISRIINKIRREKITVELRKCRGISLVYVTYTTYSGKVNLDKLSGVLGSQSRRILCDSKYIFPQKSGFLRFESDAFKIRLCTNMAYQILKASNGNGINLGIYDPNAVICDFMLNALEYCQNVIVVTDESKMYYTQLNRALDELGATAVITNKCEELENCNLIISPLAVGSELPIRGSAIVLTTTRPTYPISGLVYCDYSFKIPASFAQIKPEILSDEYFCSALYTLENQYELGSIIPSLCSDGTNSQTVSSIVKFLSQQK